tara:strand:+ start:10 stop:174 length:165 start_codon:yes stop_codon:yes gene_type:complete
MIINNVPDEDNLIAVPFRIDFLAKLQVSLQTKRLMQITNDKNTPLLFSEVLERF